MSSSRPHSSNLWLSGISASALLLSPFTLSVLSAQVSGRYSSAAEREMSRRQTALIQAQENMSAGDTALASKDYETAISQYRGILEMLPDAPIATQSRSVAITKLTEACVALAQQRIAEGRFEDAEALVDLIIDKYDAKQPDALRLKNRLNDDYYNKTVTPGFVSKVEAVNRLLSEADGFYNTGRFDLAMKRTDQVLGLDPYNSAARRMQEKINNEKSENYVKDSYEQTRSRSLYQVGKAWDSPVRAYSDTLTTNIGPATRGQGGGKEKIIEKLNKIIIPSVDFRNATIAEALDFLRQRSKALDQSGEGISIVLRLGSGSSSAAAPAPVAPAPAEGGAGLDAFGAAPSSAPAADSAVTADTRITLKLDNAPLGEVLKYIANLAQLKTKVEEYAVLVVPASEPIDTFITREFRVPPGFLAILGGTASSAPAAPTGGGFGGGATGATTTKQGVKELLEANGVVFPPGTSASYLSSSSKLIVKNTEQNMELIETIIDSTVDNVAKQVTIEAKFVEISQTNLKELGFDWQLGQFSTGIGGDRVYAGGGSTPNQAGDYQFTDGTNLVGGSAVTSNNRSGNVAISANAVDALIAGTTGSPLTAGVFSLAGVFTDPQFQVVIRALDQKKGVDLLSAPRVTTRSGQSATVQITREFRYPTEFDPPQIPQTIGGSASVTGAVASSQPSVFPVTPTTPTSFETKNTGVTLEVEPTIGPDGVTIDLRLSPEVVEFDGFINYGSPIQTVSTSILGSAPIILTPNVINQPIFSVRKVTTNVSVYDGSTVVLGGLMREDVQKVSDKVPLLGDIPLVGRLFRSEVDQHVKRNLIIFVTANLIGPDGFPLKLDEDLEETVTQLGVPAPAVAPAPDLYMK